MLKDTPKDELDLIAEKGEKMADWLSVVQHHDAITGTERQYVNMDYEHNLFNAFEPNLYQNYMKQKFDEEMGLKIIGDFMLCR